MSEFKLDVDVPIPLTQMDRARAYPLREMKIGNSFFVPGGKVVALTLAPAASAFARRNPEFAFTVRRVREDGIEGYRVWRIAKATGGPAK